jgi:hypothetical protein
MVWFVGLLVVSCGCCVLLSNFLPSPVADRVIAGFAWAASLAGPTVLDVS